MVVFVVEAGMGRATAMANWMAGWMAGRLDRRFTLADSATGAGMVAERGGGAFCIFTVITLLLKHPNFRKILLEKINMIKKSGQRKGIRHNLIRLNANSRHTVRELRRF